jgi:hypothetical protein
MIPGLGLEKLGFRDTQICVIGKNKKLTKEENNLCFRNREKIYVTGVQVTREKNQVTFSEGKKLPLEKHYFFSVSKTENVTMLPAYWYMP